MRSVSGLQGGTNTEWHKGCFENTAQAWAVFLPKLGPPSIGGLFVYTSSNDGSDHHDGLTFAKFNSMLPRGGKRELLDESVNYVYCGGGNCVGWSNYCASPVSYGYGRVSSSPKRLQKL
jgi:hypothetical protein